MEDVFVRVNHMTIQREVVVFNGVAYNLAETMIKIDNLFHEIDGAHHHLIMNLLSHMRYIESVDPHDFMIDHITGVYTPFDTWFEEHGVIDMTIDILLLDDTDSVDTFSVTLSEENNDEECIESEDEEEFVMHCANIRRLAREDEEERGFYD